MLKCIQINLNCCKAAQALLQQVATEKSSDFIFASEPNRDEGQNWYMDTMGKAAVVNIKRSRLDDEGKGEAGFRWISAHGIRLYSCYWSPNTTLPEYLDFLTRLEHSLRSERTEAIITGDFNAKHIDWGSPKSEQRGEALADLINALGLVICNKGKVSTFHKGSILDLTLATANLARKVTGWRVLDDESLSDHFYIVFDVHLDAGKNTAQNARFPKIDFKKLESELTSERFNQVSSCKEAEGSALALTEAIHACRTATPIGKRARKSVHWWNPELSVLHSTANHLRRVFQRKRKRHGTGASTAEEAAAKEAKRELVQAIRRAKETSWKSLCDQVQRDPWGLPYKLVMGKLTRPPPIPELNIPGRLQHIVDGLFPKHPIRSYTDPLLLTHNTAKIHLIDRTELTNAARSLKPNISPGPDGITNEVVKTVASRNPDLLLGVYNTCLINGVFPSVWKKARLVLIRKGDKPLDTPSSYRPLCLLDCLGKLFEKLLDNRLRLFLDTSDGLHERQFGFRKGRSTIDALEALRTTVKSDKSKVGILTLDIKNAFNSAPWNAILEAIREKEVPEYLQRMIHSYLENRLLCFESGGIEEEMVITCGVPQGSVLGPTLWNVLYDGLLRTRLPIGVEYLAFADDVALVAKASDSIKLEQLLTSAARRVQDWLTNTGLALSAHKCEAMIVTNTRTHNDMNITLDGHRVSSSSCIKYLGIHIDSKWRFTDHAKTVATKAGKVAQGLSRIMPNISAAKPTKRRLLSNVVHSIMLYGSPFWAQDMNTPGWIELAKVQRRMCLRVASSYRTVSGDAIGVIAGIAPIDLLAKDRNRLYQTRKGMGPPRTDENTMEEWQHRWSSSDKGRWTYRLIPDINKWQSRRHGEVNFHLTQVLSGHGCFAEYLHRFGKLNSPECWYCGHVSDDAAHTVFACDAWYSRRNNAEKLLNVILKPENMIEIMLRSRDNWGTINTLVYEIMSSKEREERRRQAVN